MILTNVLFVAIVSSVPGRTMVDSTEIDDNTVWQLDKSADFQDLGEETVYSLPRPQYLTSPEGNISNVDDSKIKKHISIDSPTNEYASGIKTEDVAIKATGEDVTRPHTDEGEVDDDQASIVHLTSELTEIDSETEHTEQVAQSRADDQPTYINNDLDAADETEEQIILNLIDDVYQGVYDDDTNTTYITPLDVITRKPFPEYVDAHRELVETQVAPTDGPPVKRRIQDFNYDGIYVQSEGREIFTANEVEDQTSIKSKYESHQRLNEDASSQVIEDDSSQVIEDDSYSGYSHQNVLGLQEVLDILQDTSKGAAPIYINTENGTIETSSENVLEGSNEIGDKEHRIGDDEHHKPEVEHTIQINEILHDDLKYSAPTIDKQNPESEIIVENYGPPIPPDDVKSTINSYDEIPFEFPTPFVYPKDIVDSTAHIQEQYNDASSAWWDDPTFDISEELEFEYKLPKYKENNGVKSADESGHQDSIVDYRSAYGPPKPSSLYNPSDIVSDDDSSETDGNSTTGPYHHGKQLVTDRQKESRMSTGDTTNSTENVVREGNIKYAYEPVNTYSNIEPWIPPRDIPRIKIHLPFVTGETPIQFYPRDKYKYGPPKALQPIPSTPIREATIHEDLIPVRHNHQEPVDIFVDPADEFIHPIDDENLADELPNYPPVVSQAPHYQVNISPQTPLPLAERHPLHELIIDSLVPRQLQSPRSESNSSTSTPELSEREAISYEKAGSSQIRPSSTASPRHLPDSLLELHTDIQSADYRQTNDFAQSHTSKRKSPPSSRSNSIANVPQIHPMNPTRNYHLSSNKLGSSQPTRNTVRTSIQPYSSRGINPVPSPSIKWRPQKHPVRNYLITSTYDTAPSPHVIKSNDITHSAGHHGNSESFDVTNQHHSGGVIDDSKPISTHSTTPGHGTTFSNLVVTLKNAGATILIRLIQAAELDQFLAQTGPYTIFAPTEDALDFLVRRLGGVEEAIRKLGRQTLRELILYHVIRGYALLEDLANDQLVRTMSGGRLRINQYATYSHLRGGINVTTVNGEVLVRSDLQADNGMLHFVSGVLAPPPRNLLKALQMDPLGRFSVLQRAIKLAHLEDAFNDYKLGPLTMFAPTDRAFTQLPPGQLRQLLRDRKQLRRLILNHMAPGSLYSSGLKPYQQITTLAGDIVTIFHRHDLVKINTATVLVADITAENGVVHAIDAVLLPSSH